MKTQAENRLVALLGALATREGPNPTSLSGVKLYRISQPQPRQTAVYEPWIIIVARGSKRVYFGGDVYVYDADNYFVTAVPMPAECEIPRASAANPYLSLTISVDPAMIGELLLEMDGESPGPEPVPRGLYAGRLTRPMRDAALRLLDCLESPTDSRVLGPQCVREIVYRVLQAKGGEALRALAARDTHFGRISRVLDHLHRNYAKAIDVETLARQARMSPSVFYQKFKAVTAVSPLQYVKNVRLGKARLLMVQDGYTASAAAFAVGYESAPQFSREYKRQFGVSPSQDAKMMRS
ncbi:MAG: AraC family transcriptional regulator [Sedimentisphaerales bacterium]|nr:AraC family transcriptional regulator [Sedimentisphaerales bacterium]